VPPDPFFSGPGLDRADQLRARPEALAALAAHPDARQLTWSDGAPALDEKGRLAWQPLTDPTLFLGLDGEAPRFSPLPDDGAPLDARAHFALLANLAPADAPLFAAALSLANWHRRHLFCAACGNPTLPNRGGWSRACACGAEHYPRVDPVVIMLAEHGGRVLLGRQHHYPPGRYSALAGFVEAGETIEAAVARELFEEAGIRVGEVSYLASQPWPFPSSLMVGAHAVALDDSLTIDTNELDDARWFTRPEVAAALAADPAAPFLPPPRFAVAATLLERWLIGLK
jgi:NAD+ diphosphatase